MVNVDDSDSLIERLRESKQRYLKEEKLDYFSREIVQAVYSMDNLFIRRMVASLGHVNGIIQSAVLELEKNNFDGINEWKELLLEYVSNPIKLLQEQLPNGLFESSGKYLTTHPYRDILPDELSRILLFIARHIPSPQVLDNKPHSFVVSPINANLAHTIGFSNIHTSPICPMVYNKFIYLKGCRITIKISKGTMEYLHNFTIIYRIHIRSYATTNMIFAVDINCIRFFNLNPLCIFVPPIFCSLATLLFV